ncbi:triphosphoribosyl-dephospho-CoA synthase, partial [Pseudomonas aeruginosa]|nr:triphosphoribosyl-dephospho-CoA synthase [Pseudomonas aeruginosa]
MNAIANLAATPCADLGECLADLAVDALIDEAELSPKPALVDRRGNGAHADLHLGLMQASALKLRSTSGSSIPTNTSRTLVF